MGDPGVCGSWSDTRVHVEGGDPGIGREVYPGVLYYHGVCDRGGDPDVWWGEGEWRGVDNFMFNSVKA